jgi:hypothetical protein
LGGIASRMSNENYDLEDFLDKKDFSVKLQEEAPFTEPFFVENTRVLNYNLDSVIDATENTATPHEMINETPKGIILIPDNYFHYFPDFIGPIYSFLNNCIELNINNVELIGIDISNQASIGDQFSLFLHHCLEKFSDRIEISYTVIKKPYTDFSNPLIRINNSRVIDQRDIGISLEFIYESAKTFSESTEDMVPNKMVFISRRSVQEGEVPNERTRYEEDCEEFFRSIGFEVVQGEAFEDAKSEISYFRDVKVFAGFTGSGLTNSMFMNPKQTFIEIVCPIKFKEDPEYEIHNFYKTISLLKGHKYIAVPNINNSKEELLEQLEDVARML